MSQGLFTIDVGEELRAISREQLRASWQVPAELVRLAVSLGAEEVAVERRRRGFALRAAGAAVDGERIEDLATALDPTAAPDARHRALLRLERGGAQALLWAAGATDVGGELRLESCGGGRWTRLAAGGRRRLAIEAAPGGERDEAWFSVGVTAPAFDGRRASEWVRLATRFCPVPVVVDGASTRPGFGDPLLETRCRDPLPGLLAVAPSGDSLELWLLRHGVVATRATAPGWPPFAAAVELTGLVPAQASPDQLREAVGRHLGQLAERVADMILAATVRFDELAEPARERLTCVLLRMARAGFRRQQILAAPVIRVLVGGSGDLRWRSALELKESWDPARPPRVAEPGARTPQTGDPGTPTVVLSTEERCLLGDLLGLTLEGGAGAGAKERSWRLRAARVMSRLHPRCWWPARRRIVPSDELLQAELGLLAVLNGQLAPPLEARLCAGDGAISRRRNRLLLPRQNPLVVKTLRLASADRSWLYPAALALLGEEARPAPELRDRWRQSCLSGGGTSFSGEVAEEPSPAP